MIDAFKLLLAVVAVATAPPTEAPAVSTLEAAQAAPIPAADAAADAAGPLAFRVTVRGRCADADQALTVAGMLGDTLSAWHAPGTDGRVTLSLDVPRDQLVFTSAALCRRAGDDPGPDRLLTGAFSAQVFARCAAADGRVAMRAASAPLSLRYSCPPAAEPGTR